MLKIHPLNRINIIILCIPFLSCCHKYKVSDSPDTISIHLEKDLMLISPDSIFTSVTYLPLETTDESIFYEINKILIHDDIYYLLDKKQSSILTFDKDGKYLKKLMKIGLGPGEYVSLDDFFILDSLIYILASNIQKIVIYGIGFNFINDIPINTHSSNIDFLAMDIYIYTNFCSSDLDNIHVIDKMSGKKKNSYCHFKKKQMGVGYLSSTFAKWNNRLFAFFPYDYTIYLLTQQGYDKYLNIDFGEKNIYPSSFLNFSDEERTNYIKQKYTGFESLPINRINNLYLSEKFLFFTFIYHQFEYKLFLNRENNRYTTGYLNSTEKFPFADSKFLSIYKDQVITYLLPEDAYSIIERNERRKVKLDISYDFFKQIDLLDNPILCKYTLK